MYLVKSWSVCNGLFYPSGKIVARARELSIPLQPLFRRGSWHLAGLGSKGLSPEGDVTGRAVLV